MVRLARPAQSDTAEVGGGTQPFAEHQEPRQIKKAIPEYFGLAFFALTTAVRLPGTGLRKSRNWRFARSKDSPGAGNVSLLPWDSIVHRAVNNERGTLSSGIHRSAAYGLVIRL